MKKKIAYGLGDKKGVYDSTLMHFNAPRNIFIYKVGAVEPCVCEEISEDSFIQCLPQQPSGDLMVAACQRCGKQGHAAENPKRALEKWNKMLVFLKHETVSEILADIDRKLTDGN